MEYIYAALLLDALGKDVSEDNLKSVVKAAGKEPDEAMVKSVASSLKGVNIKEVVEKAQTMQQVVAPAAAAEQKKPEAKQEEEKKSEEEAAGGLAGLFG